MKCNLATLAGIGACALMSACTPFQTLEGTIIKENYDKKVGHYVLRVKSNDAIYTINVIQFHYSSTEKSDLAAFLEEGDVILFPSNVGRFFKKFNAQRYGVLYTTEIKKVGKESAVAQQ